MSGYVLDPDCSFGAFAFIAFETGDLARKAPGASRAYAERHVPWGSRTIVQDLGPQPVNVGYTIWCAKSALPLLRSLVMQTATLAIVGEPARSGVLLLPFDEPDVDDINGIAEVAVTFRMVP